MTTTVSTSEVPRAKKNSKQRTLNLIKSLDPEDDERTGISKKISWILRHGAKVAGVKMNDEGWVAVSDLVKAEILDDIDLDVLMQVIVDSNGKKLRYELKDTAVGQMIKAYSKKERKAREAVAPMPKTSNADAGMRQDAPAFVPSNAPPAPPTPTATPTAMPMSPAGMGYPWPGFGFPPMMPPMFNPFMAGWPQVPPGKYQGRIKSFNSDKGFGFIECATTYQQYSRDVFLHKAQIGDMAVGTVVTFSCEVNKQGMPQAKDVAAYGGPGMAAAFGGGKGKGKGKGKGEKGEGKGKGEKGEGKAKGKGKKKEGKDGDEKKVKETKSDGSAGQKSTGGASASEKPAA